MSSGGFKIICQLAYSMMQTVRACHLCYVTLSPQKNSFASLLLLIPLRYQCQCNDLASTAKLLANFKRRFK